MNKESRKTIEIRRYQNRKLYDTLHSSYITLDDIAKMIKIGEDVRIIDNRTKDDLTSITLTQIIFEEEKKKKSFLPLGTLKKIIQEGGDTIKDFVEKTREGAEKVIDRIKDELTPNNEGNIFQEVIHKTQDFSKKFDEKIKSTLESVAHVPSLQNEVHSLRKKIALLEKKLKEYE